MSFPIRKIGMLEMPKIAMLSTYSNFIYYNSGIFIQNKVRVICDILPLCRIKATIDLKNIVQFRSNRLEEHSKPIRVCEKIGSSNFHIINCFPELIFKHSIVAPIIPGQLFPGHVAGLPSSYGVVLSQRMQSPVMLSLPRFVLHTSYRRIHHQSIHEERDL